MKRRVALMLLALLVSVPALNAQELPKSPVQRIVVLPAPVRMTAQDTLRLVPQALDANGRPVTGVVFSFLPSSNARFEGTSRRTGW